MLRGPALLLTAMLLSACGDEAIVPATTAEPRSKTVIVPKRSIAAVRLGTTAKQVQRHLGKPDLTRASELHGGWVEWQYRGLRVTLDQGRRVWSVRTYTRAQRTPSGVGVGSTERQIRRAMSDLRCQSYGGPPRYRRWRVCVDTKTYSGPFTTFTLVRARARHVTVAQGLAR